MGRFADALTNSNGGVVERYVYDPYGGTLVTDPNGAEWLPMPEPWPSASPGNPSRYANSFMWTGQRCNHEVGLYHFYARSYSPDLGRWLQRDPLGYVDGANLHEYVASDPLGWIDSLGLESAVEVPGLPAPDVPSEIDPGDPDAPSEGRDPCAEAKDRLAALIAPLRALLADPNLPEHQRAALRRILELAELQLKRAKGILTFDEEAYLWSLERQERAKHALETINKVAKGILETYEIIEGITIVVGELTITIISPIPGDEIAVAMAVFGKIGKISKAIRVGTNVAEKAKTLKTLTKHDIKMLKKKGVDVHDLKGGKRTGKLDLYKDKEGNIYIMGKGGTGEPDPTGLNLPDL